MSTLLPIRVGASLQRTYTFYNPETPLTDPPTADTDDPIDLTGVTVTFHIEANGRHHSYTTAAGVTVTPLLGKVVINLTPDQTGTFATDEKASSYLQFAYLNGDVIPKVQQNERIIAIGTVE